MQTIRTKTIGEIVAGNYLMSEVFQKYGINYCCEGERTFMEVCLQNAIDPKVLEQELRAVARDRQRTHHFDNWQLDYLMDHIIHTHHYYVWTNLPVIKEYALKSARMYGDRYPQQRKINDLVVELANEMEHHLQEEEHVYFPYIRKLVQAQRSQKRWEQSQEKVLYDAIDEIHADHIYMGSVLKMIVELSNDFKPPKDSGATLQVLYQKLKDFQADFYQHIHLENNILFPKAIRIEKELAMVYQ